MILELYIAIGCLIIVQVLFLIAVFRIRRRIERLDFREWEEHLNCLEDSLEARLSKLEAEMQANTQLMQQRLQSLESFSRNNTDLFETVLHGFDFIVQGCKSAVNANRSLLATNETSLEHEGPKALEEEDDITEWRNTPAQDIETDEWAAQKSLQPPASDGENAGKLADQESHSPNEPIAEPMEEGAKDEANRAD